MSGQPPGACRAAEGSTSDRAGGSGLAIAICNDMTEVIAGGQQQDQGECGCATRPTIRTTPVRSRSAAPSGSVRRSGYCRRSVAGASGCGAGGGTTARGTRRRPWRRGRRRERAGPQLADDGARLDAAILVAVARAVQLERAHVPRRARHLAGAVARSTGGHVPVPRLGEVAAPGEEHRGSGGTEADDELRRAVAGRRPACVGPLMDADRPAPDRQPSRHAGIGLGSADGQPVGREPVGREGGRAAARQRRAHRRDATATRAAQSTATPSRCSGPGSRTPCAPRR